jgi:hypothetical protein
MYSARRAAHCEMGGVVRFSGVACLLWRVGRERGFRLGYVGLFFVRVNQVLVCLWARGSWCGFWPVPGAVLRHRCLTGFMV